MDGASEVRLSAAAQAKAGSTGGAADPSSAAEAAESAGASAPSIGAAIFAGLCAWRARRLPTT